MSTKEETKEAGSPKEDKKEVEKLDPSTVPRDPKGIIDRDILDQIREMDEVGEEDDDEEPEEGTDPRKFSRGIVFGFFEQAQKTFGEMEDAIAIKDLTTLSKLGHFLKGSSAALGIIKVQAACQDIQYYGDLQDHDAGETLSGEEALRRIVVSLKECKKGYAVAEAWLTRLYDEPGAE